ncbi:MAG: hypothetical protein ACR2L2_09770 [Acidobacteriota bacterium]
MQYHSAGVGLRNGDACRCGCARDGYRIPQHPKVPVETGRFSGIPPDVKVEFVVDEILKGSLQSRSLIIAGYLFGEDDYNDNPVPYGFVRKGGRGGSCFANGYRKEVGYLLFLKLMPAGLTPYWYALGPVNEQLRSPDDPWVWWVKGYLSGLSERSTASGEP